MLHLLPGMTSGLSNFYKERLAGQQVEHFEMRIIANVFIYSFFQTLAIIVSVIIYYD